MNLIWKTHAGESCPSCLALNKQVHDEFKWMHAEIAPKSYKLYCSDNCKCTLSDAGNDEETGDLKSVPLKYNQEMNNMTNPRNTELRFDGFKSNPVKTAKGYEILCIHPGQANGWKFSADVLKPAAKFFDEIECFADHNMFGESVHDLAGVFSNARWDDSQQGIIADLRPTGPAAELLRMYADEMLSDNDPHPNMGFSPVIIFTSKGEDVEQILRVRSVDMVINPAFKTKFLSEKFQKRSNTMPENTTPPTVPVPNPKTLTAMKDITGAQAEISASVQGAKENHLAMCATLLDTALNVASVDLPEAAINMIAGRFHGKTFKPQELKAEIDSFKEAFAQSKAAASVVGPAQITGMFTREDQLQAAIDDLLDAPRNEGSENLKVHRFKGIQEAYLMLTGDFNFTGDIDQRLAKFQGTTATFPYLVASALNKSIVRQWTQFGKAGYNWWEKIATVEHFDSIHDIKWLRLGTIASLPTVAEGAEYTELKLGDNGETSTFVKYGGYLSFTLEAMDKDDTRKLRAAPREIAMAALRNISEQIAAMFTSNSGAGPTLEDSGALFNSTAVTTAGGHKNLLTDALGTDYTAWNAVATAVYDQPMLVANETGSYGTGKKQALEPNICLVPRALKAQAEALFLPRWASTTNAVEPSGLTTYGGFVTPITVPEWTDATDWAAVVDPQLLTGIMIGERFGLIPQIIIAGEQSNPAMFSNDESRLKVRHFLATGIGNWSALHKSNVA